MRRADVFEQCYNLSARRVARGLTRLYDHALRSVELTSGQFSILAMLSEEPVPSQQDMADMLGMDRTTLIAALKPLERRGLVGMTVSEADRRRRHLTLTSTGHETYAQAASLWAQVQSTLDRESDSRHLEALDRALARLTQKA